MAAAAALEALLASPDCGGRSSRYLYDEACDKAELLDMFWCVYMFDMRADEMLGL